MNTRKDGPIVLITALQGDPYNLGILMCAIVTSITRFKIVYLGIDSPIDEIIRIAKNDSPRVITFSISHSMSSEFTEDCLFRIRGSVSEKSLIITGGKGSPYNIPGVSHLPDFKKYYEFLQDINN